MIRHDWLTRDALWGHENEQELISVKEERVDALKIRLPHFTSIYKVSRDVDPAYSSDTSGSSHPRCIPAVFTSHLLPEHTKLHFACSLYHCRFLFVLPLLLFKAMLTLLCLRSKSMLPCLRYTRVWDDCSPLFLLFFQKTWVPFPESSWSLTAICTFSSREPIMYALFWPSWTLEHIMHVHTCRQNNRNAYTK